ncbi:MAG: hypothetical protein OEW59_09255 [Gammaproteobacteria bacterium]|nr:hypothetical protein [Gammaproteobacteria bacterium]
MAELPLRRAETALDVRNFVVVAALKTGKYGAMRRHGIGTLKNWLALVTGLLASLFAAVGAAQSFKPFPGDPIDNRTRAIQERVEAIYSAGDYERALLIYEGDLAPVGDKYAQYMVGYMHLHAQSVPRDPAEALAWYRLAAERGTPLLVESRDQLAAALPPAEIAESDQVFVELWRRMSDRVLLVQLIRRDMEILRQQTGSRIPGARATSPLQILRPDGETVDPNYYRNVRSRLEARIAYLDAKVEISDDVVADELKRIRGEEAAMKEELASMERR